MVGRQCPISAPFRPKVRLTNLVFINVLLTKMTGWGWSGTEEHKNAGMDVC
jgi:hypothetical protein